MTTGVKWDGLTEFVADLQRLPQTLRDQARAIVDDTTQKTANELRANYPEGDTGNLRRGVTVRQRITFFGVVDEVVSLSPHAHLWEFGTQNRTTRQGWNRGRVLPARDRGQEGLIPIAMRNRRAMYHAIADDVLTEAGFEVSGVL